MEPLNRLTEESSTQGVTYRSEASSTFMLATGSGLNKNKKVPSNSRFHQGVKVYTSDCIMSKRLRVRRHMK